MTSLLNIADLQAGYGPVRVLHGISLEVNQGEVVAILGANGAGKSTLMGAIVGLVRPTDGSIRFADAAIGGITTEQITRRGLTLVPEGRRVFAKLTVLENLRMGAYARRDRATTASDLDSMLERFPVLGERRAQRAGTLSGGEQQQLAICRALMSRPQCILLDEPSLGLAPVMVDRVFELVAELRERDGLTVVLVEQSIANALEVADRAYLIANGRVTASGTSSEMTDAARALEGAYLGGDTE
ncbi:MAG: ABC transporter ATP-binding protein [Leifsonia sp.]|nr:ABC transporter ATP-binding protein [Leifsonia sp.]